MRAEGYQTWYRYDWEKHIFPKISRDFGSRHRLTKEELLRIILFKAERSKSNFKRDLSNKAKEVSRMLRAVRDAKGDTEIKPKIDALCKIDGIGLGLASAILAACYPRKFTIMDRRVWKGIFGDKALTTSAEGYLRYNRRCLQKAKGLRLSLRDFDRMCWGRSYHSDLCKEFGLRRV